MDIIGTGIDIVECARIGEMIGEHGAKFVEALSAEGLHSELGYPGPIPLYLYPVIKQKRTFGSSGWPFDSPAARKLWDYPEGTCPLAERACRETVVLPWNEGLRPEHVELMASAIRKVTAAYGL